MINTHNLFMESLVSDPEPGQEVAIIVHDTAIGEMIAGRLYGEGIFPRLYTTAAGFIQAWERAPKLFERANSLIVHKDLGERNGGGTIHDVVNHVRGIALGQSLRTIAASGEFSYDGVSKEARDVIQVDGGYDPTGIQKELPPWVLQFIKLGLVSPAEQETFRGKEIVLDRDSFEERRVWLGRSAGPEREH